MLEGISARIVSGLISIVVHDSALVLQHVGPFDASKTILWIEHCVNYELFLDGCV